MERASRNDSGNVSPLLGGSWGIKETFYPPELAAAALFAFVVFCLCWIWIKERHNVKLGFGRWPELVFVLVTGAVNVLLSLALFSRALNYQIFFIVPFIVGLLVLSSPMLEVSRSIKTRRLVLALWLGFAALGVGIRATKIVEFTQSWSDRNPRPILTFIKENVPANSKVLGLDPCYFWAVQESGSKYLWIEENTTPGLNSHSGFDAGAVLTNSARHRVYLLWKRALPIPSGLSTRVVRKTASFEPAGKGDHFSRFRRRISGGYPATELYELKLD
jgi:hypothetical protein